MTRQDRLGNLWTDIEESGGVRRLNPKKGVLSIRREQRERP